MIKVLFVQRIKLIVNIAIIFIPKILDTVCAKFQVDAVTGFYLSELSELSDQDFLHDLKYYN